MTSTLGDRMLWRDGDVRVSQCAFCRHKGRDQTCSAFPAGIPAPILGNEVSHERPIEGDHGVRLEPTEIASDLFEHVTGLPWPASAVGYDQLEAALAHARDTATIDDHLAALLRRADLLSVRARGDDESGFSIATVADSEGIAFVPLFSSIPRLQAFYGRDAPRVRLTLENFPDGFGGHPVVINPGSDLELALDLEAINRADA